MRGILVNECLGVIAAFCLLEDLYIGIEEELTFSK